MKLPLITNAQKALSMLGMAAVLTFTACDDDAPVAVTPEVPASYNFENVDYSGQLARLQMVNALVNKAKEANDGTTKVTASELQTIFVNESGDLFGSDKTIKNKTEESAVPEFESYFHDIETYSGNEANIVGGYLVTETGVEPVQMIAKGLMGALMYYQATSVYLGDDKMSADNTEVTEGKGTALQHHWDEAFGYFGAPIDYLTEEVPEGTTDPAEKVWFWAGYANERAEVIDAREEIFNAFIAGRAAINRNDLEARGQAIATIKEHWEELIAANVVHYLNTALENLQNADEAKFYHHWAEGKAFLNALKYNLDKSISNEDLEALNASFGDSPKDRFKNQADTEAAFGEALVKLQEVFGFTNEQMLQL